MKIRAVERGVFIVCGGSLNQSLDRGSGVQDCSIEL
jgi:hypothetical protein